MSSFLPALSSSRKKQANRKPPTTFSSTNNNNHIPRDSTRDRLNRIFDQYKDTTNADDIINVEGTIQYFQTINLDPEEPAVLALGYQLNAPSLGVFNRQSFVEGWRSMGCDSIQSMTSKVAQLREQFKIDDQFHKRVYLFTYAFARPEGQRALPLDMAIEYWKLLLQDRYAYLDLWIEFLHERYNKTIPKDTWNLFYDFVQDIGTDFNQYDENGAWPVVIDEFVVFGKKKVECLGEDKMMED